MNAARARPVPADDAPHILVVDDDKRLRDLLSRFLSENGYRVSTAKDAAEARARLATMIFDGYVLDVMMPGENGFSLAGWIRETSMVPIIMLTARSEATDRVRGLEIGADDYVMKPFEPRELVLRLNNILRRTASASPPVPAGPEVVRFGPYTYRFDRGELRHGEEIVRITDRERDLLSVLAARPGETVPRDALAGSVELSNERTIDVQINRLRRKIEADPANPALILTEPGIGYRFATQEPS
jgi:two-component system phosphate regulon response regulator OmpR